MICFLPVLLLYHKICILAITMQYCESGQPEILLSQQQLEAPHLPPAAATAAPMSRKMLQA